MLQVCSLGRSIHSLVSRSRPAIAPEPSPLGVMPGSRRAWEGIDIDPSQRSGWTMSALGSPIASSDGRCRRPALLVAPTRRLLAILLLAVSSCRGSEIMPVEIGPEDRNPSWSPDGQWIAFEHSDSSDAGSVYVIRTDGTGRRRVLASAFDPDWSPDGGFLVVNVGALLARVSLGSGEVLPLEVGGHGSAWSPDGETIAFSSNGGDGTYPPVLWTVPAAGGTAARVPLPGPPRTELREVDWSPTSTHLVAAEAAARQRLFITTLAGLDTSRIAVPDLNLNQPGWSPRGDRIAYVRSRAGEVGDIWLVRPDGSNHRLLVPSGFHPSWSPDGGRVAFARREGSAVSIWAVDTLGQNIQRITPSY